MNLRKIYFEEKGGQTWLRVVSNGGLWYYNSVVEPSGSAKSVSKSVN
jgi:hypothetical protein